MLNYETLLSSYDDKLTLMQWLKKVEGALKDASAVAFKVNQRGNATLTFSVEFEDGTELETGPIVLQQGESVVSAAIVGGHLKLTLSNGDVLDAGDLGGVSSFSIDASQHLIVHYQNGTTQDLGAIFEGNITISGILNVTGNITSNANVGGVTLSATGNASVGGVLNVAHDITAYETISGGYITGGEIVERMTGYSFAAGTGNANLTREFVYAGAVKNGNKLTLVVAVNLTRTDTITGGDVNIGVFGVPSDILARLYPAEVGGYNYLDNKIIQAWKSDSTSVPLTSYVLKSSGVQIRVNGGVVNNLELNTKYYYRYEVTFLLSTNLAS